MRKFLVLNITDLNDAGFERIASFFQSIKDGDSQFYADKRKGHSLWFTCGEKEDIDALEFGIEQELNSNFPNAGYYFELETIADPKMQKLANKLKQDFAELDDEHKIIVRDFCNKHT
jgi:hypothetical protein